MMMLKRVMLVRMTMMMMMVVVVVMMTLMIDNPRLWPNWETERSHETEESHNRHMGFDPNWKLHESGFLSTDC